MLIVTILYVYCGTENKNKSTPRPFMNKLYAELNLILKVDY